MSQRVGRWRANGGGAGRAGRGHRGAVARGRCARPAHVRPAGVVRVRRCAEGSVDASVGGADRSGLGRGHRYKRIDRGDRRDGGLARAAVRLAPSLPAEVDARRRGVLAGRSGAVRCRVPHPLRWALGVRAREGRAVAVEHGVGARGLLCRGAATAHASAAVAACGRPGGRNAAGVALRRSPSGVGGPVRRRRPVRGRGGQLRLSPRRRRGAVARASR